MVKSEELAKAAVRIMNVKLRKQKKCLLEDIQGLDKKSETQSMSDQDWSVKYQKEVELVAIYAAEELHWQRGGGEQWILKRR